ncbi:MAG TPA: HD-GYP domain-containing protein [Clostridiales bacterium]|nr:HD-GYP domain-containing protein [Clostridiales bacterium]
MKKVFISVRDCRPVMKIAEDIFNDYGAVIIADGTILDEHIIGRITDLGFTRIRIYDTEEDINKVSGSDLFRTQYIENVNSVKSILHDISSGKEIDAERVDYATSSILSKINENREIVSCISEMRAAGEYLYTHSINVALLSMLLGKWLKYDYSKLKSLVTSAFLHDIGKSKVPPEILNKPGPLDEEEFGEVRKHCMIGYKLAESFPGMNEDILKGILLHHEREDGSGYPFGLKGDRIHEIAKIIAVADIYDAMTSNRYYKEKRCPFEVIEYIEKEHLGTLDHRITSTFLRNIASYYIGEHARLSSGETGEIVYINPYNISKPIVKCADRYIDLSTDSKIRITEMS